MHKAIIRGDSICKRVRCCSSFFFYKEQIGLDLVNTFKIAPQCSFEIHYSHAGIIIHFIVWRSGFYANCSLDKIIMLQRVKINFKM